MPKPKDVDVLIVVRNHHCCFQLDIQSYKTALKKRISNKLSMDRLASNRAQKFKKIMLEVWLETCHDTNIFFYENEMQMSPERIAMLLTNLTADHEYLATQPITI